MTKNKLLAAVAIFAALFAFKAMFPQTAGNIIDRVGSIFSRDIDYHQVFTDISEYIPIFHENSTPTAPMQENDSEQTAQIRPVYVQSEHASTNSAELLDEIAANSGENYTVSDELLPDAVAAFLKSQEEFSELELPDKVSYDYIEFPVEYSLPVVGYNSSGFGYRTHPIHGDVRFHYGTDFAAWSGEDIYAFADGTVTFSGYCDSYGNYITIEHEDGWESLYAHCSVLYAENGDRVKAGERIALVGDTGLVTGPHLHFELSKDGIYTNPEYYVN